MGIFNVNMKIVLNEIDDIKQFAKTIMGFSGEGKIIKNDKIFNAKSIMSIIAIDPSEVCELELESESLEEINKVTEGIKNFIVKGE